MTSGAGRILLAAREGRGLSQRGLAHAAGTAQSVVARIELGQTSPSWDTLARLVAAAGSALSVSLTPSAEAPPDGSDMPRVLALTPAQRLQEQRNAARFFAAIRPIA
jgi:transcriptional regulator with XRE-family HTH domain